MLFPTLYDSIMDFQRPFFPYKKIQPQLNDNDHVHREKFVNGQKLHPNENIYTSYPHPIHLTKVEKNAQLRVNNWIGWI